MMRTTRNIQKHIFFHSAITPSGPGPTLCEASRSHSDTTHSVGIFWTRDRPVAGNSNSQQTQKTSIPRAGFEPAIPASERQQIHVLQHAGNRDRCTRSLLRQNLEYGNIKATGAYDYHLAINDVLCAFFRLRCVKIFQ